MVADNRQQCAHRLGFATNRVLDAPSSVKAHETIDASPFPDRKLGDLGLDLERVAEQEGPSRDFAADGTVITEISADYPVDDCLYIDSTYSKAVLEKWLMSVDIEAEKEGLSRDMAASGTIVTESTADYLIDDCLYPDSTYSKAVLEEWLMNVDPEAEKESGAVYTFSVNPTPRRSPNQDASTRKKTKSHHNSRIIDVPNDDLFNQNQASISRSIPGPDDVLQSSSQDSTFNTQTNIPLEQLNEEDGMADLFQKRFEDDKIEDGSWLSHSDTDSQPPSVYNVVRFRGNSLEERFKVLRAQIARREAKKSLFRTSWTSFPTYPGEEGPKYYLRGFLDGPLASLLNACLEMRNGTRKPKPLPPPVDHTVKSEITLSCRVETQAELAELEAWTEKCALWISSMPKLEAGIGFWGAG